MSERRVASEGYEIVMSKGGRTLTYSDGIISESRKLGLSFPVKVTHEIPYNWAPTMISQYMMKVLNEG